VSHQIRLTPNLQDLTELGDFETGHLPVRYYLPKLDVGTDLLVPSPARTRCPLVGIT
jgi:uncharacterized protein (DUF427 family)